MWHYTLFEVTRFFLSSGSALNWHLDLIPVPPLSPWACCSRCSPRLHQEAPWPLQLCYQSLWIPRRQARKGRPGRQFLPFSQIFSSWSNQAWSDRRKCTFKNSSFVVSLPLLSHYNLPFSRSPQAQRAVWNDSHLPHYDCQYQQKQESQASSCSLDRQFMGQYEELHPNLMLWSSESEKCCGKNAAVKKELKYPVREHREAGCDMQILPILTLHRWHSTHPVWEYYVVRLMNRKSGRRWKGFAVIWHTSNAPAFENPARTFDCRKKHALNFGNELCLCPLWTFWKNPPSAKSGNTVDACGERWRALPNDFHTYLCEMFELLKVHFSRQLELGGRLFLQDEGVTRDRRTASPLWAELQHRALTAKAWAKVFDRKPGSLP